VRKEIAIGYLKDGNDSICEIALLLGFADQSAFHHAFKRWTGQTPGEYRKFKVVE
jgi:AraC-like DNA-binding protein